MQPKTNSNIKHRGQEIHFIRSEHVETQRAQHSSADRPTNLLTNGQVENNYYANCFTLKKTSHCYLFLND